MFEETVNSMSQSPGDVLFKKIVAKIFAKIYRKLPAIEFFAEVNLQVVNMVTFGVAHLTRSLFLETFHVAVLEKDFSAGIFEETKKIPQWLFLKKIAVMLFMTLIIIINHYRMYNDCPTETLDTSKTWYQSTRWYTTFPRWG